MTKILLTRVKWKIKIKTRGHKTKIVITNIFKHFLNKIIQSSMAKRNYTQDISVASVTPL